MILVDYGGSIFPIISHSPWNGVHLADFVMPFFLFLVGVSLALAYKVCMYVCITSSLHPPRTPLNFPFTIHFYLSKCQRRPHRTTQATSKAFLRALQLFILGILLQGLFVCVSVM
jgi:predicted acyltransferase